MKKVYLALGVLLIGGMSLAYAKRASIRLAIDELQKPTLPQEQMIAQQGNSTTISQIASSTTNVVTSTKDGIRNEFPKEINLSVPFILQAPSQNWDLPYQETCEEASLLMALRAGQKAPTLEEADAELLKMTEKQIELFGQYFHTSATQTVMLAEEMYGAKTSVISLKTMDDIKKQLAKGYPVIIPADGKKLQNPNFRNGGPIYHMLVIKGYLEDGRWITNDPGTRKGKDYIYHQQTLWNAIADWSYETNAPTGPKKAIIVIP